MPPQAEAKLVIGGMTCAARVQAKLNKVTGITATVSLSTERAHATAPAQVPARDLIGVIEAADCAARWNGSWRVTCCRRCPGKRSAPG